MGKKRRGERGVSIDREERKGERKEMERVSYHILEEIIIQAKRRYLQFKAQIRKALFVTVCILSK
jgi:hypothetical protein